MENNQHRVNLLFSEDLLALWKHTHLEDDLFIKECLLLEPGSRTETSVNFITFPADYSLSRAPLSLVSIVQLLFLYVCVSLS